QRLRGEVGRDDDVEVGPGDLGRGRLVDRAVGRDDAAEGGHRVAAEGAAVGLREVVVRRQATGDGVLDDGDAGAGEVDRGAPGGVGVHDVVVGELLAVELARGDQAGRGRPGRQR